MPAGGFSIAHTIPESTATHTWKPVAPLCGASSRASWIDSREPNQYAIGVTCEQHAELVDAFDDLLVENPLLLLHPPVAPGQFVHRQHRIVARMIGVMHRRPLHDLAAFTMREIIGQSRSIRRA